MLTLEPLQTPTPDSLAFLALNLLVEQVSDPALAPRDRRLAAAAILRHIDSRKLQPPSPSANSDSSAMPHAHGVSRPPAHRPCRAEAPSTKSAPRALTPDFARFLTSDLAPSPISMLLQSVGAGKSPANGFP